MRIAATNDGKANYGLHDMVYDASTRKWVEFVAETGEEEAQAKRRKGGESSAATGGAGGGAGGTLRTTAQTHTGMGIVGFLGGSGTPIAGGKKRKDEDQGGAGAQGGAGTRQKT